MLPNITENTHTHFSGTTNPVSITRDVFYYRKTINVYPCAISGFCCEVGERNVPFWLQYNPEQCSSPLLSTP